MPVSAEVESLIADAPLSAHLATSVDDRPHVAPVWYGYRNGTLYFITGGRKLSNVRRNPRVAVSIEKATDGDVEWNVMLRGTATVRDDPDRIDWASGWIYDTYENGNGDTDGINDENERSFEEDADTDPEGHPDDTQSTNGEENSADQQGTALVEVEIGSGSANVYE